MQEAQDMFEKVLFGNYKVVYIERVFFNFWMAPFIYFCTVASKALLVVLTYVCPVIFSKGSLTPIKSSSECEKKAKTFNTALTAQTTEKQREGKI